MEFRIVLLPLASWHGPLPYPPKYRAMIEDFCASNKVPPPIDFSNLLPDDDFGDHIHVNATGLPKIDAALMAVAQKFLADKGIWPGR